MIRKTRRRCRRSRAAQKETRGRSRRASRTGHLGRAAAARAMIPASRVTRKLDEARLSTVDLTGKTVLVTGASSGRARPPRARSPRAARAWCSASATSRRARGSRAGSATASRMPRDRVLVPHAADLSSNASVAAFARMSSAHAPVLDVLVNNAGVNFLPKSLRRRHRPIAQINFLGPPR